MAGHPAAAGVLNPRVLLGGAALLVTGLLFLLYFYRRRLYIRYWIMAWMLGAISPFLIAHRFSCVKANNAMYGLSQFVGILSALVFVVSADAYRTRPRIPAHYVPCCCRCSSGLRSRRLRSKRRPSTHRAT